MRGFLFCIGAVATATALFAGGGESLDWKAKRDQRRIERELDDHIEKVWKEVVRDRARKHKAAEELAQGWNKFLSKGHSKAYVAGGVVLIVWLCYQGSIGCDRNKDEDEDQR